MNKVVRNLVYGVISWAVPFLVSFGFIGADGQYLVDVRFFKGIMVVTGILTAALLLLSYFRHVRENPLWEGVIIGFSWLAINLGLDLAILVPMAGMTVGDYATQIGFGYLAIPIVSIMLGRALSQNKEQPRSQPAR